MRVLFSKGIAALSKPRCGSTSLRRMLDPLMDKAGGDIAVNTGGAMPPFHPHITAPYLKQLLRERGHDPEALAWIITVRHPVEMLWSYWKFFKPDVKSRYNFAPKWDETAPMPFERWIAEGKLRANPDWAELAPEWISSDDLSPLSLEFRAMNRDGSLAVDEVFRIEEPERLAAWLEAKTGQKVAVKHTNRSREAALPAIGAEALARIRTLLPQESALYGV